MRRTATIRTQKGYPATYARRSARGARGSSRRSSPRRDSMRPRDLKRDNPRMDETARHLRLLTETIAAVNSSSTCRRSLELVASKVAGALGTDACFVYLYDEGADELVLRATHGSRVEEMTRTPRMRPGRGSPGRPPRALACDDLLPGAPRPSLQALPNLPEDEYESILAVPIVAREKLEGALNVRTRDPRAFTGSEIELLVAIASQVAQTIEHASSTRPPSAGSSSWRRSPGSPRRCPSRSTSRSRSRRSWKTTMESLHATGAALVLEDGKIAWPEGRAGARATPAAALEGRQIGELVCDRDTPFTDDDRALLEAIAHHAAVALEHGRAHARRPRRRSTTASRTTSSPSPRSSACRRARRTSSRRRCRTPSTASSRSRPCTRC